MYTQWQTSDSTTYSALCGRENEQWSRAEGRLKAFTPSLCSTFTTLVYGICAHFQPPESLCATIRIVLVDYLTIDCTYLRFEIVEK